MRRKFISEKKTKQPTVELSGSEIVIQERTSAGIGQFGSEATSSPVCIASSGD